MEQSEATSNAAIKPQTCQPIVLPGGAWPTIATIQTWELKKFN
ncbi:hypothetical protein RISK_003614 [Rhodopirellula islandica]|uniref:Uncharacterized protein n=1 Tax=Rhodopirellula islandica TaxID=595434 RepID=A0A0J1BDC4_RHOIS|nr:hypothetical protein RISK_003614 [Rhodopirellula islandica]